MPLISAFKYKVLLVVSNFAFLTAFALLKIAVKFPLAIIVASLILLAAVSMVVVVVLVVAGVVAGVTGVTGVIGVTVTDNELQLLDDAQTIITVEPLFWPLKLKLLATTLACATVEFEFEEI